MPDARLLLPPRTSGRFRLYTKPGYFAELVTTIGRVKPGGRVLLAAMTFDPHEPAVHEVAAALQAAARRGAQTTLMMDAHTFMFGERRRLGPLWFHAHMPARMTSWFHDVAQVVQSLRQAGVTVTIVNQPGRRFTNPFAGRSHIKTAIIDDTVFIGGCNLTNANEIDLMTSWKDDATADWLYELMRAMAMSGQSRTTLGIHDRHQRINTTTDLFIDAGMRRQSRILEHALRFIDETEDWLVITCQYFPNSITARHLKQAVARGVRVFPIFNHFSQHAWPQTYLQHSVTARERLRMPAAFFRTELAKDLPYLHAKLIASEKGAMLGSHNYVQAGINLGTAEIALRVREQAFAQATLALILDQTGLATRPELRILTQ